jgi:uncharacterized protein YegP (UPF0339 family)
LKDKARSFYRFLERKPKKIFVLPIYKRKNLWYTVTTISTTGVKLMGKFVIKKTPTGAFNFSLYAANKEKIAVSSQVYSTKAACKKGMESIAKNAAKCIAEDKVEDQTLKTPTAKTCPKFEIYFDKAGLYRYRLIATNGECVAICEEGYKSKSGVMNGIKSVSVNAVDAEIVDETIDK